jgi:hypothetical protein
MTPDRACSNGRAVFPYFGKGRLSGSPSIAKPASREGWNPGIQLHRVMRLFGSTRDTDPLTIAELNVDLSLVRIVDIQSGKPRKH